MRYAFTLFIALSLLGCDSVEPDETHTLSLVTSPVQGGNVDGYVNRQYDHGEEVKLTADPWLGWYLGEWRGDLSESGIETTFAVDSSMNVEARFETYDVDMVIIGRGTVRNLILKQKGGQRVQMTAQPGDGWAFDRWQGDVGETSENPITVDLVDEMKIEVYFRDEREDSTSPSEYEKRTYSLRETPTELVSQN